MSETNQYTPVESIADTRIVGLDRNKTRNTNGSDKGYQVYFELSVPQSGTPQAWRNISEREWKDLNPTSRQQSGWQEAIIDRRFLAIHCTLQEMATHLPALKKAVAVTIKIHEQYVQEQAREQER